MLHYLIFKTSSASPLMDLTRLANRAHSDPSCMKFGLELGKPVAQIIQMMTKNGDHQALGCVNLTHGKVTTPIVQLPVVNCGMQFGHIIMRSNLQALSHGERLDKSV